MGDDERRPKVEQILRRLSDATDRQAVLLGEAKDFTARIPEVRERLGNPFFYSGENWSRPENADESIANYTGYRSHEPGLCLVRALRKVQRELHGLHDQLRELGEAD